MNQTNSHYSNTHYLKHLKDSLIHDRVFSFWVVNYAEREQNGKVLFIFN